MPPHASETGIDDFLAQLDALLADLQAGVAPAARLAAVDAALDRFPPGVSQRLERKTFEVFWKLQRVRNVRPAPQTGVPSRIADFLSAWLQRHRPVKPVIGQPAWVMRHLTHLRDTPSLRRVFVLHPSGHVREAALEAYRTGLTSAFDVCAIAYRMNDWNASVRQAARRCAFRTFPQTGPDIVAAAALVLFQQAQRWGRWTTERNELFALLHRADVLVILVRLIETARQGPMARVLGRILRHPSLDPGLPRLASHAAQPSVRAIAYRTLIDGEATWPDGTRQEWVDKIYNRYRVVTVYGRRPVERDHIAEHYLMSAASDASAAVRRIAADALIRHYETLANRQEVAGKLSGDRSKAVTDRIAFLARRYGEAAVADVRVST